MADLEKKTTLHRDKKKKKPKKNKKHKTFVPSEYKNILESVEKAVINIPTAALIKIDLQS